VLSMAVLLWSFATSVCRVLALCLWKLQFCILGLCCVVTVVHFMCERSVVIGWTSDVLQHRMIGISMVCLLNCGIAEMNELNWGGGGEFNKTALVLPP
jgi:hypothetical protein